VCPSRITLPLIQYVKVGLSLLFPYFVVCIASDSRVWTNIMFPRPWNHMVTPPFYHISQSLVQWWSRGLWHFLKVSTLPYHSLPFFGMLVLSLLCKYCEWGSFLIVGFHCSRCFFRILLWFWWVHRFSSQLFVVRCSLYRNEKDKEGSPSLMNYEQGWCYFSFIW